MLPSTTQLTSAKRSFSTGHTILYRHLLSLHVTVYLFLRHVLTYSSVGIVGESPHEKKLFIEDETEEDVLFKVKSDSRMRF